MVLDSPDLFWLLTSYSNIDTSARSDYIRDIYRTALVRNRQTQY
jgi:hypothetical protein